MALRNEGYCPICREASTFVAEQEWLRDGYTCVRCRSIPRQRALVEVLDLVRPAWRTLTVHESSPSVPHLAAHCPGYSSSQLFPDVERGGRRDGVRCEDLERLTFGDGSFDVFVTQDVLEHVFDPGRALSEIVRCLKPGGVHVFTTPKHRVLPRSRRRAEVRDGAVVHLLEPEYHGNPVGDGRALVTWDFGADLEERVQEWGGYLVSTYVLRDRRRGIEGEFLEVFVQERVELNRTSFAAAAAAHATGPGSSPPADAAGGAAPAPGAADAGGGAEEVRDGAGERRRASVHPAHVALLLATAAFFLYVNLKAPLAGEDFAHMPWPLGEAPSGLGAQVRAVASAVLHQMLGWAWRIGEALAVLFGAFPKDVFSVANAAVLTALVPALFFTALGRLPDWRRGADAFRLLVLVAALLALLPVLGSLLFWPAGALNHTWALFGLLCYAGPFRLLASGRDAFATTSAPRVALYCAAGIPAGMTVESAGPVVVAWALLVALWKRRTLPRWVPWATASLAAGTAFLLFAPSTTARRALYATIVPGDDATGVALFARRLARVLRDHLGLGGPLVAVFAALALCWIVVLRRPLLEALRRRRAGEPELRDAAVLAAMVLTSAGSVLALATIPYHSDQIRGAAMHWFVLLAAVAFLAGGLWIRLSRPLRAAVAVAVVAVVAVEMGRISRAYAAYHAEAAARHHDILRQRREGIRDVSVDVLLTRTARLIDTREQWATHAEGPVFIARYYGVGSFAVGGSRRAAGTAEAPRGARLLHAVDTARVHAGVLEVRGWAVLEGSDAAAQTRYVVLRRTAGGAARDVLLGTSPVIRTDVAQGYGRTEYARAGFEARVEAARLPPGEYEVGVLVVHEGASGMQVGGVKITL